MKFINEDFVSKYNKFVLGVLELFFTIMTISLIAGTVELFVRRLYLAGVLLGTVTLVFIVLEIGAFLNYMLESRR